MINSPFVENIELNSIISKEIIKFLLKNYIVCEIHKIIDEDQYRVELSNDIDIIAEVMKKDEIVPFVNVMAALMINKNSGEG